MTASTPEIDWNELWMDHKMNVAAVGEIAEQADRQMKQLMSTLRGYRLHKKRCTTENEVDFGLLAELTLELEKVINDW